MFTPVCFQMESEDEAIALLNANPLACVCVNGDQFPVTAHVPFLLENTENLLLIGHVNRSNPIVEAIGEGAQALIIFRGSDAYISPNYYPSKKDNPKVVPTWNYEIVEVKGDVQVLVEPSDIKTIIGKQTNRLEHKHKNPWRIEDAPDSFIDRMTNGIVGLRVDISSIKGVSKLSQNKSEEDFLGVISGLQEDGQTSSRDIADRMQIIKGRE